MDALPRSGGLVDATRDRFVKDASSLRGDGPARQCEGVVDRRSNAAVVATTTAGTTLPAAALPAKPQEGTEICGGNKNAALVEWVRLFELELEALRGKLQGCECHVEDACCRLRALERTTGQNPAEPWKEDIDEIAEYVLAELRNLQEQVHRALVQARDGGSSSTVSSSTPDLNTQAKGGREATIRAQPPRKRAAGVPGTTTSWTGRLDQQISAVSARMARLEAMVCGTSDRAEHEVRWEDDSRSDAQTLRPEAVSDKVAGNGLVARLRHVEDELANLEPFRRHAASTRALAETEAKIGELQAALASVPFDSSKSAVQEIEAAAQRECGTLSVFDSYRVKAGLEQVMGAMEALSRQRNDDVRVLNSYLDEVYKRLDRELPGRVGNDDLVNLRSDVTSLTTKVDAIESVQLREVEARIRREVQLGNEEAATSRRHVQDLEPLVQRALEQCAESEARLRSLGEAVERSAATNLREGTTLAELQRELARLRLEVSQQLKGGEGAAGGQGQRLEGRFVVLQAELEALVERKAIEAVQRTDRIERDIQASREEAFRLSGDAATRQCEDMERITREVSACAQAMADLEAGFMDKIVKAESDFRSEIRVVHQLILELVPKFKGTSADAPEPFTLPSFESPMLPRTPVGCVASASGGVHRAGPSPPPDFDVGAVNKVTPDTLEWYVEDVVSRLHGDGRAVVSPSFSVPRFASASDLRLKLFPRGSHKCRRLGHCSLYLMGPEGLHLQFILRLGGTEHGPLECLFDRPQKESGRHDFCALEDEANADGSCTVRLIVTRASPDF